MKPSRSGKQLVDHYRLMAMSEGQYGASVEVKLSREEYNAFYWELMSAPWVVCKGQNSPEAIMIYGVLKVMPQ